FEARFLDFGLGRKLGDRLARDRRIERRSLGKRVLGLLRAVLLRPNERAQIDPVLLVDALEDRVAGMAALLLPERQILSFAAHRFDRTADRFDLRTEEPLDLLERMVALLLDPQGGACLLLANAHGLELRARGHDRLFRLPTAADERLDLAAEIAKEPLAHLEVRLALADELDEPLRLLLGLGELELLDRRGARSLLDDARRRLEPGLEIANAAFEPRELFRRGGLLALALGALAFAHLDLSRDLRTLGLAYLPLTPEALDLALDLRVLAFERDEPPVDLRDRGFPLGAPPHELIALRLAA